MPSQRRSPVPVYRQLRSGSCSLAILSSCPPRSLSRFERSPSPTYAVISRESESAGEHWSNQGRVGVVRGRGWSGKSEEASRQRQRSLAGRVRRVPRESPQYVLSVRRCASYLHRYVIRVIHTESSVLEMRGYGTWPRERREFERPCAPRVVVGRRDAFQSDAPRRPPRPDAGVEPKEHPQPAPAERALLCLSVSVVPCGPFTCVIYSYARHR